MWFRNTFFYRNLLRVCRFLHIANIVFFSIFAVEMICMIAGWGMKFYWTHTVTAFDGCIVITSALEMFLLKGAAATAFRAFRFFRVISLMKKMVGFATSIQKFIMRISIDEKCMSGKRFYNKIVEFG